MIATLYAMLADESVVIKMLEIAICDDEPLMIEEISACLCAYMAQKNLTAYHISAFTTSRSLLKSSRNFDFIFLDIQMEQPNGIETARLLRQRNYHSLLIFITILKEYVFDAFEVEAYDYLVKPLEKNHFHRTMDRGLQTLERRTAKTIIVRQGSDCVVVPLDDIVYCEVQGRKIYLHKKDSAVVNYYEKLENLERQVDRRFFKCHRSYLVNLDFVYAYENGQISILQSEKIPVSRLRERDFMQALLRHMKERDR